MPPTKAMREKREKLVIEHMESENRHEFDVTLAALQEEYGFAMLILTREVRHVFQPGRKVAVLVEGRIVACGDRETVLANEHPIVRRLLHRRGGE